MLKFIKTHYLILVLMSITACAGSDINEMPLNDGDIARLRRAQAEIVQGQGTETIFPGESAELQIDRRILEAVRQMVATLKPEYKRSSSKKYRLGFMEISDLEGKKTGRLHKYVSEKTLTFSFLQPDIAENMNIVERFLLKDVKAELKLQEDADTIDQKTAKKIGYVYGVDLIEIGVTTETDDFIDLNLRMVETKRGRIVAVGSVKIEKTAPIRKWANKIDSGLEYDDYMSE